MILEGHPSSKFLFPKEFLKGNKIVLLSEVGAKPMYCNVSFNQCIET